MRSSCDFLCSTPSDSSLKTSRRREEAPAASVSGSSYWRSALGDFVEIYQFGSGAGARSNRNAAGRPMSSPRGGLPIHCPCLTRRPSLSAVIQTSQNWERAPLDDYLSSSASCCCFLCIGTRSRHPCAGQHRHLRRTRVVRGCQNARPAS